jgi:hypothetical protein
MTITSSTINGATFGSSPEPLLNEGADSSNAFTINGTGLPGNLGKGDISFGFPGYAPNASAINSQSTTQVTGSFPYNPTSRPGGGEPQTTLIVTVTSSGSTSYPSTGTYPVKINQG